MARHKVGERPKNSGGGDPNILQLKDTTRIRIVDEGMVDYKQHYIVDQKDPEQGDYVVCPGPGSCPLCRKPSTDVIEDGEKKQVRLWPISKKFAMNVWSYDDGAVKVGVFGPSIYDEIAAAKEVGYDPLACDWRIHKTGQNINTRYRVVRGNEEPFTENVGDEDLHDLDKYDTPTSIERIFEVLTDRGYDYDSIKAPSFTEDEALEFVLPFGRMKGMTIEQALATDQEWCEWLHGAKLDDGAIGDPIFVALQTAMEARGIVKPVEDEWAGREAARAATSDFSEGPAPEDDIAGPDAEPGSPDNPEPDEDEPEGVKMLTPDGSGEVAVPEGAVAGMLGAGFTLIEVEPEAEATEPTPEIDDDTPVEVVVAGSDATLPFGAAKQLAKGGTPVEFKDPAVAKAAEAASEPYNDDPADAVREAAAAGEVDDGLDLPTEDEVLEKLPKPQLQEQARALGLKVSGSKPEIAKRIRQARAAGKSAPAAANGGGSDEDRDAVLERVKGMLRSAGDIDHTELLNMFEKVTGGKRNIADFTGDELVAVEGELKKMVA